MAFWFNVSSRRVETDEERSDAAHVLGPYATRAEAEAALDTAHRRTEAADAADRAWSGDDDMDDDDED